MKTFLPQTPLLVVVYGGFLRDTILEVPSLQLRGLTFALSVTATTRSPFCNMLMNQPTRNQFQELGSVMMDGVLGGVSIRMGSLKTYGALWIRGLQIPMILNLPIKVRKDLCFPGDDFGVSSRLWPFISFSFSFPTLLSMYSYLHILLSMEFNLVLSLFCFAPLEFSTLLRFSCHVYFQFPS
jgi:hypothetical protein